MNGMERLSQHKHTLIAFCTIYYNMIWLSVLLIKKEYKSNTHSKKRLFTTYRLSIQKLYGYPRLAFAAQSYNVH